MLTNITKTKTMAKHIQCDCKCKFNSATCKLNQKWNNETCQCQYKNYCKCEKDYSCNPSVGVCENSNFKSIADTSTTACDETISVLNIVPTKKSKYYSSKCVNKLFQ